MKTLTISKRFKALIKGIILLVSLVAISDAGAQMCVPPPSGMTNWWPGDGTPMTSSAAKTRCCVITPLTQKRTFIALCRILLGR